MISFIITTYNHSHCINNVVSTIINNVDIYDYDYDIIIVDNNSDDNTYEYCRNKYGNNKKISIYRTTQNNYAEARNIGIDKAKNEKLCFIDGDDYLNIIMLEDIFDQVKNNKHDIYIMPYLFEEIETIFHVEGINHLKKAVLNNDELFNLIITNGIEMFKIPSFIIDKHFLIKNNIIFDDNVNFCINIYNIADSVYCISGIDWWYYKTKNILYARNEKQIKYLDKMYNVVNLLKNTRYKELSYDGLTIKRLIRYGD